MATRLVFCNGQPLPCGCKARYDSGGGNYSETMIVELCEEHSPTPTQDAHDAVMAAAERERIAKRCEQERRPPAADFLVPKRPDCFDFAMDFLGGPEDELVIDYVEKLEASVATLASGQIAAARSRRLRAALRELVTLKDLKERIDSFDPDTTHRSRWLQMRDDYLARKPAAWAAARAAIDAAAGVFGGTPKTDPDYKESEAALRASLVDRLRNGPAPLDDPDLNDQAADYIEQHSDPLMDRINRSGPFADAP